MSRGRQLLSKGLTRDRDNIILISVIIGSQAVATSKQVTVWKLEQVRLELQRSRRDRDVVDRIKKSIRSLHVNKKRDTCSIKGHTSLELYIAY